MGSCQSTAKNDDEGSQHGGFDSLSGDQRQQDQYQTNAYERKDLTSKSPDTNSANLPREPPTTPAKDLSLQHSTYNKVPDLAAHSFQPDKILQPQAKIHGDQTFNSSNQNHQNITGKRSHESVHNALTQGALQSLDWEHKSQGKQGTQHQQASQISKGQAKKEKKDIKIMTKKQLIVRATQRENALWKQIDDLNKRATQRENSLLKQIDDLNMRTYTYNITIKELRKETEELKIRIPEAAKEMEEYHLGELAKYKSKVEDARNVERAYLAKQDKTIQDLQQANDDLRARTHMYSNTIQELRNENDELKIRLSSHFGAKLQDNNPHIADLSDINRPTKLAEKFSELYDNEWTNCFEVLIKHGGIVERDAIALIHQACVEIYNICRDTASRDLHDLKRVIRTFSNDENVRAMKDLKESRKRRFKIDIERLKPAIQTKMEHALKGTFKEPVVAEFWTKCLEICWLMVIQDPPVSMDTRHNMEGDMFNATLYRDYTKRGKYVEYMVWPALLLTEGGSILAKGVAQGIDVRTEMKEDISKPDAEKNMQQANAQKSVGAIQSDSTKSTKDKDSKAKEQSLRNDMKQLGLDAKSTSDGEKCLQQDNADIKEYSKEEGNHAQKPPKECSTTPSLKLDVYTNANEGKSNPLHHGGKPEGDVFRKPFSKSMTAPLSHSEKDNTYAATVSSASGTTYISQVKIQKKQS